MIKDINVKYLTTVIEECAEVIQACTKTQRFGLGSTWEGSSNFEKLTAEVGDLLCVLDKLVKSDTYASQLVEQSKSAKEVKLQLWGPERRGLKSEQ